jgi:hypothetical protein
VSVVGKGRERGLQSIIAVDERLSNLENRLRLSFELELTQKLFVLVVRRSIAMRRVNGLAGGTSLPTSLSARARLTREIKSLRTHYNSLQVRWPQERRAFLKGGRLEGAYQRRTENATNCIQLQLLSPPPTPTTPTPPPFPPALPPARALSHPTGRERCTG